MWTTSNFPVNLARVAILFVCLAIGIVAASYWMGFGAQDPTPPDAPRQRESASDAQPSAQDQAERQFPVELKSVTVRRLDIRIDTTLAKMAGPEFLSAATDPLVIEVQTEKPLGNLARTSSPVIILNKEQLQATWATGEDRLVAFLPDRKSLKDANTVAVAWIGNEEETTSRHPLTFKSEDLK
jgi:hypothetical protein